MYASSLSAKASSMPPERKTRPGETSAAQWRCAGWGRRGPGVKLPKRGS